MAKTAAQQPVIENDVIDDVETQLTAKQERKRAYTAAITRVLEDSADVFKVDDLSDVLKKVTRLRDRRWKKFQRKQERQARKPKENEHG
jgi:hypothetical protein